MIAFILIQLGVPSPANKFVKYQYQDNAGTQQVGQRIQGRASDPTQRMQPSASRSFLKRLSKLPKDAQVSSLSIDIALGHTNGKLYWIVIRGRRPGVYFEE